MRSARCVVAVLVALTCARAARAQDAVPAADASPPPAPTFTAYVVGSGCFGTAGSTFSELSGLQRGLRDQKAPFLLDGASLNGLSRSGVYLLPEGGAAQWNDARHVDAFLSSTAPETREVLDPAVPVLLTPTGVYFQQPARGRTDWLARMKAERDDVQPDDGRRMVPGRLSRVVRGTQAAWLLELPDLGAPAEVQAPLGTPVDAYEPRFVVRTPLPDDVKLYGVDRAVGQAERIKGRLDAARATDAGAFLFHLGGVVEGQDTWCTQALMAERADAAVPTRDDVKNGPKAVQTLGTSAHLPWVLTNLRPATESADAPPRWRLLEQNGRTALVVSAHGESALAGLSAAQKGAWKLLPLGPALDEAFVQAKSRLGRNPDVVIALSALAPDESAALRDADAIHIVIEVGPNKGLAAVRQAMQVAPQALPSAPVAVFSHARSSLGRLQLVFGARTPTAISFDDTPATDDGPTDDELRTVRRKAGRAALLASSQIVFPDPDAFIRAHPVLHPFVWGDSVVNDGRRNVVDQADNEPPQLTDPLWLLFLANVMRSELGADAAFIRNHLRPSSILGPIIRGVFDDWLDQSGDALVLTLRGEELVALMHAQNGSSQSAAPNAVTMTSGVDSAAEKVGGRAVDMKASYRVVVSRALAELPRYADVLGPHLEAGDARPIRDVVTARLKKSQDASGALDPAAADGLLVHLLPDGDAIVPRFSAGIEELSGNALAFRNSENISAFAVTRETRASNPNLFQGGLRLNAYTLFDSAAFAWENRLRVSYDGVLVDVPDVPLNARISEQRDDVVLSTELRANQIGLAVAADRLQIVPYVQAAFDSELSPTPNPSVPDAWLPLQLLFRETLGLTLSPGPLLKEVRLGAIVQHDISDVPGGGPAHHDVGATAGYRLQLPLVWKLLLQSELDVRYLVPDGDDRAIDLALRLQAVEKVVLPLSDNVATFVFVDGFLFSGKTAANADVGWNAIAGVGLTVSGAWR